jgi:hypothetical protein
MDTIETFFTVNASEIPAPERAALRAEIVKHIQDSAPLNLAICPDHLRDALRRMVNEERYRRESAGQKFPAKFQCFPQAGSARPSTLKAQKLTVRYAN